MKKVKRGLAIILLFAMTFSLLTGCGDGTALSNDNPGQGMADNSGKTDGSESSPEPTAMGRYVEKSIDLSGSVGRAIGLYMLEDGSLIIADTDRDFLMTKDGGESWTTDVREWKSQIQEKYFINALAIGKDNTVGMIYDTAYQEPDAEDYNPFEEELEVMIVKADGTQVPVQMDMMGEDEKPFKIWISDLGRIFVSTRGTAPNIYEIQEDGSSKKFLELESEAILVQFQKQLMIIDGYHYESPLIYDMEKEQYIEDEVLNDFVTQNYPNRSNNGGSFYDLYFFMGEENVLYLAGEKGLHRHVIGGGAIEQVIDGNLSIFSNPSYSLRSMVKVNDSEFMALFSNGQLFRFTYNPDIPTVPSETLKVYSLRNDNTIKQAINLYQTAYPDVFVEYEVGMEEGSSLLREDALKNLNTKIAAGEGPDIFILDDMPIDSYKEKGLLLEVSSIVESMQEEGALFENIVEAFQTEDGIYMLPCQIQLPIVFGEKTYTSGITDLESMADAMERLREDVPEKNLCGFCTKDSIMKLFSMVSVPDWKTEKGEIDKDGLTDYLVQIKRIYDAQMDGLAEEEIERYYDLSESYRETYGYSLDESAAWIREGVNYVDYVMGLRQLEFGTLAGLFDYATLNAICEIAGYEDCETMLMKPNVFCPQTLAGISAVSHNMEQAQQFFRFLYEKENQAYMFGGFAINREAFLDNIHKEKEEVGDDRYLSMSMMDETGKVFTITGYFPDEEKIQKLQDWIESVSVPYIADNLLENAVYEEGANYLEDLRSLEDTIEGIEKKTALYMAE